jgi:hypothetical protein
MPGSYSLQCDIGSLVSVLYPSATGHYGLEATDAELPELDQTTTFLYKIGTLAMPES